MKRLFPIVAIGLISAVPLIGRQTYAASASMYLSPASSSVSQGSSLFVRVIENSGGEPVNAVSVGLSYPADKLTFVSNTPGAFPIVAASSGGGGSVHFDGGRLPPPVTGAQTIVTVQFRAKTNSGTATVSITSGSVVSANSNSDIAGAKSGGVYTLTNTPATPPPAPKDTTPPTIKDIKTTDIGPTSATITWTSSEPATTEVYYGLNKGYGLSAVDSNPVTAHKISLTSALLAPGTPYHFMVKSVDPSGNAVSSADYGFTTKGAALTATVINQHNKPVKGAKVSFGDINAVTDKKGRATLQNLPLGKQVGTVTFRHKQSVVSTEIKSIDPKGTPQTATFKINVPSNLLWVALLPLFLLLLFAAWWVGREEGEGLNPWQVAKTKVMGWLPTKSTTKEGPTDPIKPPSQQPPPTIIKPNNKPGG